VTENMEIGWSLCGSCVPRSGQVRLRGAEASMVYAGVTVVFVSVLNRRER